MADVADLSLSNPSDVPEWDGQEAAFQTIAESAPVMLWLGDHEGRCVYLNRAQREFWGVTKLAGFDWAETIHPDDVARCFDTVGAAMAQRAPFTLEARYLRAEDGAYRILETRAGPRYAADGVFLGMVGVNTDVTDRRLTEQTLRARQDQFRALADNIHQFAWMADASGYLFWYNQRWFDYTGADLDQMRGWGWQKVHHPDHVQRVTETFQRAVDEGTPWEDTFPLRSRTGEYRWFLSRALPIRNESGAIVQWFGTNTDITERLEAEEQRTLLINELNHRVKNTLATVQSLVMQTIRHAPSPDDVRGLVEARLIALSRAHDVLTQRNWQDAELTELVARAIAPFAASRIVAEGPSVQVTPKQALALSMALHELATNAAKYGALSADDGAVAVTWGVGEGACGPELRLTWTESGGPPVAAPTRRGFGARLIERSLGADLGGSARLEFPPDGLRAEFRAPLGPKG